LYYSLDTVVGFLFSQGRKDSLRMRCRVPESLAWGTRYGLEVPFLLYLSTVCLFEHQDSLIAENFTSMELFFLELSNASRVAECDIRKSRGIGPYC